jgi:YVTN family beta-propeller protein
MVLDNATDTIYVANERSNSISIINGVNNTIAGSIEPGVLAGPSGIAYDPSNTCLYVGGLDFEVTVISTTSDVVIGNISIGPHFLGATTGGILFDDLNGRIYVADSSYDNVSVINGSSNKVVQYIPVGSDPMGMAYDPSNGDIYVANAASNNVSVISSPSNKVMKSIPVGSAPMALAYGKASGDIYVTNGNSSNISVINDTTNRVIATISGINSPMGLAIDNSTGFLVVANGAVPSSANRTEPNVTMIDPADGKAVANIWTPYAQYYSVLYDPENGLIYADNQDGGSLSVIAPGPVITAYQAAPNPITLGMTTHIDVAVVGESSSYSFAYDGLPSGCASVATPSLSCAPNTVGSYHITVWVNSTGGVDLSANLTLRVFSRPSVSLAPEHLVVGVGETLSIQAIVSGGTAPFTFRYTASTGSAGCVLVNSPLLNCTPASTGSFTVAVNMTDTFGYGSNSTSAAVTVSTAPRIAFSASSTSPSLGQTVALLANVTGGLGPYTYSYSGLPPGCVSTNVSRVACLPTQAGFYNITAFASDAYGTRVSDTTEIHVIFNFTIAAPSSVTVGQQMTISVNTYVNGGLTYVYSGLPPGCPSQNSSNLTCTPTSVGAYTVTVNVHDKVGDSSTHKVVVNVVAAKQGPLGLPENEGRYVIAVIAGVCAATVITLLYARRGREMAQKSTSPDAYARFKDVRSTPNDKPVPLSGDEQSDTLHDIF